jgi:hypothetical protein
MHGTIKETAKMTGTAGISRAEQIMNSTEARMPFWDSTGVPFFYLPIIEEQTLEKDLSELLLEDQNLKKSIEKARSEMRRGECLDYEDVFGDNG